MTGVVIGSADQSLVFQLSTALQEMDGVQVLQAVDSTEDLVAAVLRLDPDLVLVHDELGPNPAHQVVRDLGMRRPACSAVMVTAEPSPDAFAAAMEAGARGVVSHPISFEDLRSRVESAAATSLNMRRVLATTTPSDSGPGRARVVTFVGAKGGVGTTTVATHLSLDVVRCAPSVRLCLVDLDLEKGDVTGLVEVRYRASLSDLAKVADDLSPRAVADAVVVHESGVHLLLTPADIRDVEAITPRALREIMAVLRQDYDVVVVDAGAHVTPAQAAAVELADEVVAVVTPDVVAVRGLRRSISMWEGLAVRKENDLRVLLNRVSRQSSLSAQSIGQLTRAQMIPIGLPSMFRRLEPAINARDPFAVREAVWWRSIRALAAEVGVLPTAGQPVARTGAGAGSTATKGRRRDRGQASIEALAILPMIIAFALVAWQLVVFGAAAVWTGHAASVAARAVSVGADPAPAVRDALPGSVADDVSVTSAGSTVTVRVRVRSVAPLVGSALPPVTATRTVLREGP